MIKEQLYKKLQEDNYSILEDNFVYRTQKQKIKIKHNTCGHDTCVSVRSFIMRSGCDGCKAKEIIKEIKELFSLNKEYVCKTNLKEIKKYVNKLHVVHKSCNTSFFPTVHAFIKQKTKCGNSKCRSRAYAKRRAVQNKVNFIKKIEELEYEVLNKKDLQIETFCYIRKKKISIKHICGAVITPNISKFIHEYKGNCRSCLDYNIKLNTRNNIVSLMNKINGYELLSHPDEIDSIASKVKIKHIACNHIFTVTIINFFYNNTRCPKCAFKVSGREKQVVSFVKKLKNQKKKPQKKRGI